MAEAFARRLWGSAWEVFSAGIHPETAIDERTVSVMREVGLDLSQHQPKSVSGFANQVFHMVVLLDSQITPADLKDIQAEHFVTLLIDDPASSTGTSDEQLEVYRKTRSQIKKRVTSYLRYDMHSMGKEGKHMADIHSARETFERELSELRDNVLRLANMTDNAIERSITALVNRDESLAKQIIADDKPINRLRYEIEEECYTLIATQQPLARDLRSIITAIHIVVELERIADYAASIAKLTLKLANEPLLKPLIDIPRMVELTRKMLNDSVDAYLNWDEDLARDIIARDDEVDMLDEQVYRELLTFMLQDPQTITRATYLLWISHGVERMADRVNNICERVLYMITGSVRAKKKKPQAES
jgi:phosphate transport system protein